MTALFLRPDADESDGGWLNESASGTNIYASVDESSLSDTDYIVSSTTDGDKVRLRLSDPSGGVTAPLIVRYRCKRVGTVATNLIGRLYQGTGPGTLIATWTELALSPNFTTYTHTLTSAEFSSISDFTDLYVEFELSQQSSLQVDLNFAADSYYDSSLASGSDAAHFLLHMDGADASTTFIDATGRHQVTVTGSAQIDTAQSKFGGASALFNGSSDLLTTDASTTDNFGTGDFTVDLWVRFSSVTGRQDLLMSTPGAIGDFFQLYKDTSHFLAIYRNASAAGGAGGLVFTGTTTLSASTWYHVALTRSGTSVKVFLNGTQEGSTWTANATTDSFGFYGALIGYHGGGYLNGWLDEFRVLKGTAAWTTTFTPPTAAYDVPMNGPYLELSCSRASIGYAKNADGTLTSFGTNTLRIGVGTGLLVEGARTNYHLKSQDFSAVGVWALDNITIGGSTTAPDGTNTADQLVENSATTNHRFYSVATAATSSGDVAWSIYIKNGSSNGRRYVGVMALDSAGNRYAIVCDLVAGVITQQGTAAGTPVSPVASLETLGDGWFRATIKMNDTGGGGTAFLNFGCDSATPTVTSAGESYTGDGVSNFYVWGAQIEQASFSSSLIPTDISSATRAADAVSCISNLDTLLKASARTSVVDIIALATPVTWDIIGGSSAGNELVVSSSDTVITSNTTTKSFSGSGAFTTGVKVGAGTNTTATSVTAAGLTVATGTSGTANTGTVYLGSDATNYWYGYIRRATVWNSKLADATLQGFTNP